MIKSICESERGLRERDTQGAFFCFRNRRKACNGDKELEEELVVNGKLRSKQGESGIAGGEADEMVGGTNNEGEFGEIDEGEEGMGGAS